MTRAWFLSLLVGCAGATGATDIDTDAAGVEPAARLATWLSGEFDSSDQAMSDPDYFAIRMVICPIELADLGERVLYVEQAQLEDLESPYRQRLYRIEPGEAPDQAVSRIYTLADNAAVRGLCDGQGSVPAASTVTERVGCAVTMTWDTEDWEGGTTGTSCSTTLGGDYATSEISLSRTELTSWDRGFYEDGTQAWGARDGGYVFVRRSDPPAE